MTIRTLVKAKKGRRFTLQEKRTAARLFAADKAANRLKPPPAIGVAALGNGGRIAVTQRQTTERAYLMDARRLLRRGY